MKSLFKEFEPVSSSQWKQKIQVELKGADYNETLVWNSPEDIQVKPFYHNDENAKSYTAKTEVTNFKICQHVYVSDVEKATKNALDKISRGAESICFRVEDSQIDVEKLLKALPLDKTPVYFSLTFFSDEFISKINSVASAAKASIFCNVDPIGQLGRDGNWFETKEKDNFDSLNNLIQKNTAVSVVGVDVSLYQNAGANIVQQIAYALAHANEYFNRIPSIDKPISFTVSVGTNYFFEIAKLRALRTLFNLVAKEYGHKLDCNIFAVPTKRNKTLYDYNVNMLRTTTECMSAILGGANTVANLPYDVLFHKENEFGDRISRNQLLILKGESHFDKVDNPSDGSYYIESLTQQLADKALKLFKEIEAGGGFLKLLNDNVISKKIQESAEKEQEAFDEGKEVLLGTNKYPNKNDKMKHDLELFPFIKQNPRKTLITPIIEKRLAAKLEQQRLTEE